jgi:hypothetical protein
METVPAEVLVRILEFACGDVMDLYTFKSVRLVCHTFNDTVLEHVPYRALEIEEESHVMDVDFALRDKFYKVLNACFSRPRPFFFFLLSSEYQTLRDLALVVQEYWDFNVQTFCVMKDTFHTFNHRYIHPNMLLILYTDTPDDENFSEATLEMCRAVLRASGRILCIKCVNNMEQFKEANRAVEPLVSAFITVEDQPPPLHEVHPAADDDIPPDLVPMWMAALNRH